MGSSYREIGSRLGGGRYTLSSRIGQGNMGEVYLARDDHLGIDVVIKFPVSTGAATEDPDFLERFDRETRSLIRLSHPHVVKVIDVGREEGRPFVVMQYLSGGSLKDRATAPLSPRSLTGWLMDVARALDFLHAQGFVHRDVKPANILFDAHGNAFLGDFGIVKALAGREQEQAGALTAPGFLLGTPNYVAPEVVMGLEADGRVDQYALAMTVHEVLAGTNVMAGPTAAATVVNQMNREPTPLETMMPGVPRRLSDAVHRALEKDPANRFHSCSAFAREALSEFADLPPSDSGKLGMVGLDSSGQIPVLYSPDEDGLPDPSAVTAAAPLPNPGSSTHPIPPAPATGAQTSHRRQFLLAAAGLAALMLVGTYLLFRGNGPKPTEVPTAAVTPAVPLTTPEPPVTLNIAYGTEKQAWLENALTEYRKLPEAKRVEIKLIGMGSVEGALAVLEGENPVPIHVWSPASSAYRDVFEREWRVKHGGKSPISRAENLALTPMVFVLWKPRYEAFIKRYGTLNFQSLSEAAREPGGWGTIAGKPDWGLFKFGHTHPEKSNSGLLTLVLMAYEHSKKQRDLTLSDVTDPKFQTWLGNVERSVTRHGGTLTNSTGTMMREMVVRGPSQYDCVVLYENLAIDYVDRARDLWDDLQVVYPEPNIWNEHPYYILDVPWSHRAERDAAARFLDFLLSEPIQRKALAYGFRPGNPSVPVRVADSPLVRGERFGIRINVPRMAEPPRAEVVETLLSSFRRVER